ncbi:MAG: GGDEF-domain containing protein [Frankiales bacterium]|nr:GGDEF-domain containing protein [Frankiales bacterium]
MALVHDEVQRARALVELHETLGSAEDDLPGLMRAATSMSAALLGDACGLWSVEAGRVELRAFTYGEHDVLDVVRQIGARCAEPDGLVGRVVRDGEVAHVGRTDVPRLLSRVEERFHDSFAAFGLTGLVLVPLRSRGRSLGALGVARRKGTSEFDETDVVFLSQVARVVSLTLANAQLLEETTQARRDATQLAREDQLTGLLNRRGFLEVLRETPVDRCTLVAVLDMDGFRLVNDGFGHAAGDLVLSSLAARLCAALPPMTPVARIGGDEFAVLVQADDDAEAADIVEDAVRECTGTLQVVGLSVPVTVSVGTAVPEPGGADQVLQHADLAMSRAKRRGGMVAAYDPDLDDPATRRLRDVLDLRRAILGDGLAVLYQPVVPVGAGPLKVEALVRRRVGDQLSPPAAWLETADRAGLMPDLTANVLRQVVNQLVSWWGQGLQVECAVNVPAPVLAGPDLVSDLLRVLDDAGLPRRSLSVEVTEGDLVGPQARAALSRCAEADIGVAVDDFGTGWSALSYLVDLPLRTLKLDRSIVDGVDLDERRVTVVRAVVDVAHDLGLHVVAEGVETQDVADVVIDLGADSLQGYLYSRPTSPEQLGPLLRAGLVAAKR